jgi:hypothetical protein
MNPEWFGTRTASTGHAPEAEGRRTRAQQGAGDLTGNLDPAERGYRVAAVLGGGQATSGKHMGAGRRSSKDEGAEPVPAACHLSHAERPRAETIVSAGRS